MSSQADLSNVAVSTGYVQLIHIGDTNGVEATAHTLYDGNGTATPISVSTTNVGIGVTPSAKLDITSNGATASTSAINIINSSSTELFYIRDDGAFRTGNAANSPYNNTFVVSANLFVNTDGTLLRATSSAKYKTQIESMEDSYADNILNLRPVWFRAKNDIQNENWSYWGLIAEEVAEVDKRLVHWNKDEAEGVMYDRIVPHLINLVKRLTARVEALEAKLN